MLEVGLKWGSHKKVLLTRHVFTVHVRNGIWYKLIFQFNVNDDWFNTTESVWTVETTEQKETIKTLLTGPSPPSRVAT